METNNAENKYWKMWQAVSDFSLINKNILKTIVWSVITFQFENKVYQYA